MAAKEKKRSKNAPDNTLPENMLPQNILQMGERVEENKNIYISQPVYREIHQFTKNKTTNESGGMLIGTVVEEFGKTNIIVSGFVEAKFCEATPTTLKFTHETWAQVHKAIDKKHKGKKIVGWIHTHPNFGIFLSEYDTFIHQNFFSDPAQIAYVIDPVQQSEGFYFWINGSIERCKGFYLYDKTGRQITVGTVQDKPVATAADASRFSFRNLLLVGLSAAVVFLMFANFSLSSRLQQLESQQLQLQQQQQSLVDSANTALFQMQQVLGYQSSQIEQLWGVLTEAGLVASSAPAAHSSSNTNRGATNG